jgi:hypothetical protein
MADLADLYPGFASRRIEATARALLEFFTAG